MPPRVHASFRITSAVAATGTDATLTSRWINQSPANEVGPQYSFADAAVAPIYANQECNLAPYGKATDQLGAKMSQFALRGYSR
jgi:hypothetical protein